MVVSVDVGGTYTRVGVSEDKKSFTKILKFHTPNRIEEEIDLITNIVGKDTSRVTHISIASPGIVDIKKGVIFWNPHRPSWKNTDLGILISQAFPNATFSLENDANSAALGEAIYGAGKDYSIVGFLTLSTGIGGGLIIDKKIVPNKFGYEPGHQIIDPAGPVGKCGQKGCFESLASGTAFKNTFGVAGEDCEDTQIWEDYARILAPGVANVIVMWSCSILVLGGGISKKSKYFLETLKKEVQKIIPFVDLPTIVQAELEEPGLYGGLAL